MHGSQVARQRPVKAKSTGSNPVRAARCGEAEMVFVSKPYRPLKQCSRKRGSVVEGRGAEARRITPLVG